MADTLYIEWDDKDATGVPVLDEQHRGILAIVNTLHFFVERKRTPEVLASTLEALVELSQIHFRTEELLLAEAGYAELARHAARHRQLLEDIRMVSQEARRGGDPRPVLGFLRAWWLNHIREEDLQYVPCLKERKKER
jgi:hemerythrin-like metal-binding protein